MHHVLVSLNVLFGGRQRVDHVVCLRNAHVQLGVYLVKIVLKASII